MALLIFTAVAVVNRQLGGLEEEVNGLHERVDLLNAEDDARLSPAATAFRFTPRA